MRWFVALLVSVMCFTGVAFAASSYEDVPTEHWAYNALDYLTKRGVLEGYPDGFFKGDRTLTRYEFAQAIARLLDTIGSGTNPDEIRVMADTLRAEFSDQLAQLAGEINGLNNMVYDLDAKVGDLEGMAADNADRIGALESKVAGLKPGPNWKGSFRYRWEYIDSDFDGNDRFRQRIAFKLGYSKQINDGVKFGWRLATNTGSNGNSSNFTLGNSLNTAYIYLDRAYVEVTPDWFGFYTAQDCSDCNPKLSIFAGIYDKSPVMNDPNEMILDGDYNFQGIGFAYHFNADFQFSGAATIVNEFRGDYTEDDVWLYSAELRHDNLLIDCLDAWVGCYGWDNENNLNEGAFTDGNVLAGFDFNNDGTVDGSDRFTPNFNTIKGGLQYTFHYLFNKPFAVYGEYMVNVDSTADDRIAAVNPFIDPDIIYEDTDDTGFVVGAQYGSKPKYCGEWFAFARYKEIGANAIIDGFGDSDLFGANRNSAEFHYATMWADNSIIGITYLFSKMHNAYGFQIPNGQADQSAIQIDWNFVF